MQNEQLIEKLNSKKQRKRISAFKKLLARDDNVAATFPENGNADCQIRSFYSHIERSPSLAVYHARKAGLPIVAVVDYASLAAMKELRKTAEPIGLSYFSGAEITLAAEQGKTLSAAALGIPHKFGDAFNDDLASFRKLKMSYTDKLADKINAVFKKYGVKISSTDKFGGAKSTTSREGLFIALAEEIIKKYDDGEKVLSLLTEGLKIELSNEDISKLEDTTNTLYSVDLAYILYNNLKLKPTEEKCKSVKYFIELCNKYGAISALVYDGGNISEFAEKAVKAGFNAICIAHPDDESVAAEFYEEAVGRGLLPLCRVVIDNPRKKFDKKFTDGELAAKFNDCAFAVVGHEISASINADDGMFSKERVAQTPSLEDRIKLYSRIGAKGNAYYE